MDAIAAPFKPQDGDDAAASGEDPAVVSWRTAVPGAGVLPKRGDRAGAEEQDCDTDKSTNRADSRPNQQPGTLPLHCCTTALLRHCAPMPVAPLHRRGGRIRSQGQESTARCGETRAARGRDATRAAGGAACAAAGTSQSPARPNVGTARFELIALTSAHARIPA